jgi:hypothetical protein
MDEPISDYQSLRIARRFITQAPTVGDRLDGVLLGRGLVHRPQVLVDADFARQACIESFGGGHCLK